MPNYDDGAVVARNVNGTYFLDVVVLGHIIITEHNFSLDPFPPIQRTVMHLVTTSPPPPYPYRVTLRGKIIL